VETIGGDWFDHHRTVGWQNLRRFGRQRFGGMKVAVGNSAV